MNKKIQLSNGLRIVYKQIPFINSITCGIFILNGSQNESKETNGLSHFIEHMLFKGTKNRTCEQIGEEIDAIGGTINAYTAKEYTCLHGKSTAKDFDSLIDILSDMLLNPIFPEEEIEKERDVILEELRMIQDDPESFCSEILYSNIYKDQAMGYSIVGESDTLNKFNRDILENYYLENYRPDNIVISLVGKFEEQKMIDLLKRYFEDFNRVKTEIIPKQLPVYNICNIKEFKPIEQVHIMMSFPSLKQEDNRFFAFDILNAIFGSGMSSRLNRKIREDNGLAYSAYSYNASYEDSGLFTVYVVTNNEQVQKVIKLISEEVKNFFVDRIEEGLLCKTKERLKSTYLLRTENTYSIMDNLFEKEVYNRIIETDEVFKKYDSVTIDEIYDLASEVLDLNKASVFVVGNI